MEWGTNGMMIYPLKSSKIVSKLSRVSTKSQRMQNEMFNSYLDTFQSHKLVFCIASELLLDASCYKTLFRVMKYEK